MPYSKFPVGAAALVDDGRIVAGCNVENAAYGVTLCAECGVVSALHATGGGRLVALSCVDATGEPLMPCGRCRQLLWEHGGPNCLIEAKGGPLTMAQLLPHAFDVADLEAVVGEHPVPVVPDRLAAWRGRGSVFVHPDLAPAGRSGRRTGNAPPGPRSRPRPGCSRRGRPGRTRPRRSIGDWPARRGWSWSTPPADLLGRRGRPPTEIPVRWG